MDWSAKAWHISSRYYLELARLTTGLFIGVMALMTFLLTVGLQHPQKPFEPIFYTTVSILAFGLIMYVIGHLAQQMVMQAGDNDAKLKKAKKMLMIVRTLQQVVFVLSILAVLALVLVSGHIFFAVPTSSAAGAAAAGQ